MILSILTGFTVAGGGRLLRRVALVLLVLTLGVAFLGHATAAP